ncbi:MAG: hypothetical protein WCT05_14680 [Lentisphaeria bacterium]
MLKGLRLFCGCSLLFILAGCDPKPPTQKYLDDLLARNAAYRLEKEVLEKEQVTKQRQIDHFKEKIGVLQEEKRDGEKNIGIARQQIKSSFTNLMKICEDSEEDLYDCFFGNAPISRGMTLSNTERMLLIDRKNHVNVDKVIFCGGELCLANKATVQFCVLRPAREKKDLYVVESLSQEFICQTPGKQKIVFPRDKRMTAFYGNLVGILLTPHAGVYYDAGGTGITAEIPVKKMISGKTAIDLPYLSELTSVQPDLKSKSRAFSFRLFGSTYLD